MEKLKKVITLNQAAKQSGYSQDYLGYLIRKGDIKGKKVGRGWFTTEEEVKNYLFRQKIRRDGFAVRGFFSRRRTNNIFFATLALFGVFFLIVFYMTNFPSVKNVSAKTSVNKQLSSDVEANEIIK